MIRDLENRSAGVAGKKLLYNAMALVTVIVWGTTFVSTKVLIADGLTPVGIFIIRFVIAYICTLFISHDRLWSSSLKDESLMLLAGLTGGSIYFIAENSALSLTLASNVSLIICCAPILTMMLGKVLFRDRIKPLAWVGSFIAFVGVAAVVFSGSSLQGINPAGDILTFAAALSWSCYCLVLKRLSNHYDNVFITRKVFAYGALTAALYYAAFHSGSHPEITRSVIGNLLFLSVGASFLCYLMWNAAVRYLGAEKTSNYIYIVPLVTILASVQILAEPMTVAGIIGASLILGGVFMSTVRS